MPRLKIFIVHPSDWLSDHRSVGDGLIAHGFLKELSARGHEIHIATRSADLRTPFPTNVTLHRIPNRLKSRPLDRLEYMVRVRSLYRRLSRTITFDVAHQMNPVFSGLSLCLAGYRVPVVLGAYMPDWPDDPDAMTFRKGLIGGCLRGARALISTLQQLQADAFLLTSPAARPRIFLGSSADSKIHYLEQGIDAEMFSPDPNPDPVAPKDPSILFLANLGVKKGIFVLLEAFSDVIASVPNCRLTIVGGGTIENTMLEIIQRSLWCDRVTVHGRIPREQSTAFYRSHTVYTLPSFGEPYGMTIVEAMACGLPVVTTAAGGPPYLVLPDGGLAVPVHDAPALATALVKLLQNPKLAHSMGARNREKILAQHTWQAVVDKLEGVYHQVSRKASSKENTTSALSKIGQTTGNVERT